MEDDKYTVVFVRSVRMMDIKYNVYDFAQGQKLHDVELLDIEEPEWPQPAHYFVKVFLNDTIKFLILKETHIKLFQQASKQSFQVY